MPDDFKFKTRPVIIDPYDAIVQKAVLELGSALKDVDVIKLETTCPSDRVAWVTNEDLLQGKSGKQRVIHLCLKKIKDKFQDLHGKSFSITDTAEHNRMKEVIKEYLKNILIPHELEHIHQEIQHGGEFGPGSESKAEQQEQWKKLEPLGIVKKYADSRMVQSILLRYISADQSLSINWVKPDVSEEIGEYFENDITREYLKNKNIEFDDPQSLISELDKGRLVDMNKAELGRCKNITSKKDDFEKEIKQPGYADSYKSMESELLKRKKITLPAPIILQTGKNGEFWGLSGNRRINLALKHTLPIKIWLVPLK